jgi:cob(I)alamin adenosyltransferase
MKIYTKTGDEGTTSLLGGTRVPKHHIKIESYGTVDELNSWLGVLRDSSSNLSEGKTLLLIQERLFTIGSHLAADQTKKNIKIPAIYNEDILLLENKMDEMENSLEPMKFFVLPGGNQVVSFCHVARCVCRRAERNITHLTEIESVNPLILQYLNRLSDYLFVLSRKWSLELNAEEIPWKPNRE